MSRKQAGIVLGAKGRAELERIVADGNTPQKIVKRARIVLMTADGRGVMAIMREVGVSKTTVWRWQDYFVEAGVAGRAPETLAILSFAGSMIRIGTCRNDATISGMELLPRVIT